MNKTCLPPRETVMVRRKTSATLLPFFFFALCLFCLRGYGQQDTSKMVNLADTLKLVPDGTEGVMLAIRPEDAAVQKLPPNEFIGKGSTFRIGMGYIQDFTTYAQSATFKQQMDSLGISLGPRSRVRDFRILGSGVLKTKRL